MTLKTFLTKSDRLKMYERAQSILKANESMSYNVGDYVKTNVPSLHRYYLGFLGEIGFHKLFSQIEWNNEEMNESTLLRKAAQLPDFSHDIEIRTIDRENLSLIVRPFDFDHCYFILMYFDKSTKWCKCLGFFKGSEAKVKEFKKEWGYGRPAFYVPQNKLKPIYDLPYFSS